MASVFDEVPAEESTGSAFSEVNTPWSQVGKEAILNFPESGANVLGSIWEAVKSPIDTATALIDLGAGALQAALPESFVKMIGEDPRSRELAAQVGKFYVDRYGSVENAKQAIAKDPAGVAADVATILGVAGGAMRAPAALGATANAGRVGAMAQRMADVGGKAQRVASFVDPLQLAAKPVVGAGKLAATKLGGVGSQALETAYEAGKAGGQEGVAFRQALRDEVDPTLVVETANQAIKQMKANKNAQYAQNKTALKTDKPLNFDGVNDSLLNAAKSLVGEGRIIVDTDAMKYLEQTKKIIDQYKQAGVSSPIGFDEMKQKIYNEVFAKIPFTDGNARRVIGAVTNQIKQDISRQAPTYSKMMTEYETASNMIREIERTLGMGDRKSADAALRKLQSVMRNNVNTNFGARLKFAQELEKTAKKPILPSLAGQALSDLTGRGMQGVVNPLVALQTLGTGGGGALAVTAPFMSPRLMGETSHLAGRLMPSGDAGLLGNLMYQTQQNRNR
jgi:hypothetical protein